MHPYKWCSVCSFERLVSSRGAGKIYTAIEFWLQDYSRTLVYSRFGCCSTHSHWWCHYRTEIPFHNKVVVALVKPELLTFCKIKWFDYGSNVRPEMVGKVAWFKIVKAHCFEYKESVKQLMFANQQVQKNIRIHCCRTDIVLLESVLDLQGLKSYNRTEIVV